MKFLGTWFLIGCLMGIMFLLGHSRGIVEGRSTALNTNPPSEQLEMVCTGLWVGEQNKKWYEKNK